MALCWFFLLGSNQQDLFKDEKDKDTGTTEVWLGYARGRGWSSRRTDMFLSEEFNLFMGPIQRCPTAKAKEADAGGQPDWNLMIGKRREQLESRGGCRREIFLEMHVTKAWTHIDTLRMTAKWAMPLTACITFQKNPWKTETWLCFNRERNWDAERGNKYNTSVPISLLSACVTTRIMISLAVSDATGRTLCPGP